MPVYEYECGKCKKSFEVLVFNLSEKVQCKFCGSKKIKKLLSSFGISMGSKAQVTQNNGSSCGGCSGGSCSTCH